MTTKKTCSATFERENETKNKVRFNEPVDKDKQVCGKIYISKAEDKKLGSPEKLKVTFEAA